MTVAVTLDAPAVIVSTPLKSAKSTPPVAVKFVVVAVTVMSWLAMRSLVTVNTNAVVTPNASSAIVTSSIDSVAVSSFVIVTTSGSGVPIVTEPGPATIVVKSTSKVSSSSTSTSAVMAIVKVRDAVFPSPELNVKLVVVSV